MRNEKFLLNALQRTKELVINGDVPNLYGICRAYKTIDRIGGLYYRLLEVDIDWATWPKFSGSLMYPVPSNGNDPSTAFNNNIFCRKSMWEGEYGQNRMELLDWLIEQLEAKLCE